MKKNLIILLLYSSVSYAQTNWFIPSNYPITNSRIDDISFINSKTGWAIRSSGQIYRTTNGGDNFERVDSLPPFSYLRCVGFLNENTGFIGPVFNNYIYKTTNSGFNWKVVNIPIPSNAGFCGISISKDSNVFIVGRYSEPAYFIKSSDFGNTWFTKNMSEFVTSLIDCYFINKDTGIVVGGIGSYPDSIKARVLKTNDGGLTWSIVFTSNQLKTWCWKIHFPTSETGYISVDSEYDSIQTPTTFLKTTNGGDKWEQLIYSNKRYFVQGIGFKDENTGWIGGWNMNLSQTTNGGLTWIDLGIGYNVNRIRFFGDSIGYASGIYIYKYSTMVNIFSNVNDIPLSFLLHQNYPNPFNPVTNIKFSLPTTQFTILKIFDIAGREIATLVNEQLNAGEYNYQFNTDDYGLSSGVYFYQLSAGNHSSSSGQRFVQTRKMLLIK